MSTTDAPPPSMPFPLRAEIRDPFWMSRFTLADDDRLLPVTAFEVKGDAHSPDVQVSLTFNVVRFGDPHGVEVKTIEGYLVDRDEYAAFLNWRKMGV